MSTTKNVPPVGVLATPADTLGELLKVSGSGYTVVRKIFRQHPADVADRVSVLGPMVSDRKRRSVQLYLLLLTVWPWLQKQTEPLSNATWARALTTEKGRRWSPTNVSEAWSDLERRGLISRKRGAQSVTVAPRREDGQAEYTRPGGKKKDHRESYFALPPCFWTEAWFERLSLPGLAMLLVIAGETTENEEQWITNKHAATWYGLSPRSVENGLADLDAHGLLSERVEWVKAPLSQIGATQKHLYSLTGDFSTQARRNLQDRTKAEVQARTGASGPKPGSPPMSKTKRTARKPAASATAGRKVTSRRRKEESA